jgi:hypothetical protein
MGIPKFYRWLSERYPLINQVVNEGVTKPEFGTLSAVLRPFLVLVPAEVGTCSPRGFDLHAASAYAHRARIASSACLRLG